VNKISLTKFIKILHLAFAGVILHNSLRFRTPKIKLLNIVLNFKIWRKKDKLNANLLVYFYQISRLKFTLKFYSNPALKFQILGCFLLNRLNFITKFSQNLIALKALNNPPQIAPRTLNFALKYLKINALMGKNYA
jgi:hypothetical protein